MSGKNGKTKGVIGGAIGVGLTALLNFGVFQPSGAPGTILGILGAAVVGTVVGIMSSGLDTTTHNRQDAPASDAAPVTIPLTGNAVADEILNRGNALLTQIDTVRGSLTDDILSGQLAVMKNQTVQILTTVSEEPVKAPKIRKYLNYYIPTVLKLTDNYRTLSAGGVSGDELTRARSDVLNGLNMVVTAGQAQIDALHQDRMLDVSTDIEVLEQMLKRDGILESELVPDLRVQDGAMTAAAAQNQIAEVPVLEVPGTAPVQGSVQSIPASAVKN